MWIRKSLNRSIEITGVLNTPSKIYSSSATVWKHRSITYAVQCNNRLIYPWVRLWIMTFQTSFFKLIMQIFFHLQCCFLGLHDYRFITQRVARQNDYLASSINSSVWSVSIWSKSAKQSTPLIFRIPFFNAHIRPESISPSVTGKKCGGKLWNQSINHPF